MKKSFYNYLFRYTFLFLFFLLIGAVMPSLNIKVVNSLGIVSGVISYDLIECFYLKFKKKVDN